MTPRNKSTSPTMRLLSATLAIAALLGASPSVADPRADQAIGIATNVRAGVGIIPGLLGDNSTDNSSAMAAALATVGDGKLYLPCGIYKFSTPIALTSARPMIEGAGTRCTKLVYTGGGTSAAFTFNASVSAGNRPGFGLRNLSLIGPNSAGSTVGVEIGDPAGVGTSQAQFFTAENVDISGFGTNVQFGSGMWLSSFRGSSIHDGGVNLSYPSTLANAGEELNFTDTTFWNSNAGPANCVNITGYVVNMNFKGGSFDNCPVTINSSNTHVLFHGVHFEQPSGAAAYPYVIQTSGYVTYEDVNVYMNALPTASALFTAAAGSVVETGLYLYNNAGTILPTVFSLSGTASFYETGTHPIIGTNGVQNFVLNTGTGTVTQRTSPNVLRTAATAYYEDPEGDSNFGKFAQAVHPRGNPSPLNLVKQSNNFTDSSWAAYGTAPTLTANTTDITDPFGGNAATKLVHNGAGNSGISQVATLPRVPGGQYTTSVWAAVLSGTETLRLGVDDTACSVTIDTTWKRYSCTMTAPANVPGANARVAEFFTQPSAQNVYLYGAQTVPGSAVGLYVPTTSIASAPGGFAASSNGQVNALVVGGTAAGRLIGSTGATFPYGTAPALSSCGTSTIDSKATNSSGKITFAGSPASCTLTFANSGFATANHCVIVPDSLLASWTSAYTLTTMTLTATALTGTATYMCDGL